MAFPHPFVWRNDISTALGKKLWPCTSVNIFFPWTVEISFFDTKGCENTPFTGSKLKDSGLVIFVGGWKQGKEIIQNTGRWHYSALGSRQCSYVLVGSYVLIRLPSFVERILHNAFRF